MLRVGVTGGIGSGKSTVASLFAEQGVPIIDTDVIAHALIEPGLPAYSAIVKAFGQSVLSAAKQIDREKLRGIVFEKTGERRKLEAILHPGIRDEVRKQLGGIDKPYCLVVVPLLIESGFTDLVDRILVVDADEKTQIERTKARSRMSEPGIRTILAAQANRDDRLRQADDVIVNNTDIEHLRQEVTRLHEYYLKLAVTKSD
ncbi:MAG: dephospho-CoA kinase [Pseudomonadota bacterium]